MKINEKIVQINGIEGSIYKDYETVRKSGAANMFNCKQVLEVAKIMGLKDLICFIDDGGLEGYAELLKGYSEAVEQGIIKRCSK